MTGDGDGGTHCSLELPLGEATETFDLEKAVCSHGLFMMAPNLWDPLSSSLSRPLRLLLDDADEDEDDDWPSSAVVRISHPRPQSLCIRVFGVSRLSERQRRAVLAQVSRMLKLSPADERNVREFLKVVDGIGEECLRGFGGRVFRSPTLFEDMVKCILLCNCQWPRTLTMARSLCELQWEVQSHSSGKKPLAFTDAIERSQSKTSRTDAEDFIPKTPSTKESKSKKQLEAACKVSVKLKKGFVEPKLDIEPKDQIYTKSMIDNLKSSIADYDSCQNPGTCKKSEVDSVDLCLVSESCSAVRIGNFPSPRELAGLSETFLAKRCNLGYRAGRILKLARGIVEGKIQLRQLEEASREPGLSTYETMFEQLRQIDGFGPFTTANVLMCMGFYHVIPTDSETIRHLKQVHGKTSSIQTVEGVVKTIYGKYSPFQFLAYWAEVWHFYGQRFGKLSEMPCTDYKLITASNMRSKERQNTKRIKVY